MIPIYLYDTDIQIYDIDITLKYPYHIPVYRYHTDILVSYRYIGIGMVDFGDIGICLYILLTDTDTDISVSVYRYIGISVYRYRSNSRGDKSPMGRISA